MTWASGFVARNPGSASVAIFQDWIDLRFDSLLNGKLVDEIAGTLGELGVESESIAEFVALLCARPEHIIVIRHQVMGCADPEDDHLYETAVVGHAGFIVSKDRKVLNPTETVARYLSDRGIEALSPERFRDILEALIDFPEFLNIDDLEEPSAQACVICHHPYHSDFSCQEIWQNENGEPEMCNCPKASPQPV